MAMASVVQNIILDVNKTEEQVRISAKKDINSRLWRFSLMDDGVPVDLTRYAVACLRMAKPNDTVIFNSCVINLESGTIDYTVTEATLDTVGTISAQLVLYQGEFTDGLGVTEQLIGPLFTVTVYDCDFGDEVIKGQDEFTALKDALTSKTIAAEAAVAAEKAAQRAEVARENADTAEKTTEGHKAAAQAAKTAAETARDEALGYKSEAESRANEAFTHSMTSERAASAAEQSAMAAEQSKISAEAASAAAIEAAQQTVTTDKIADSAVVPSKTDFVIPTAWTVNGGVGNIYFSIGSSDRVSVAGSKEYLLFENIPLTDAQLALLMLVIADKSGTILQTVSVGSLDAITTGNIPYDHGRYIRVPSDAASMHMAIVPTEDNPDTCFAVDYTVCSLRATLSIPDLRVNTDNIADGAVTEDKLAKGAVATDKIADSAVTMDKLGADVRETLSGAINRKIVAMLPSDEGTVLAARATSVSGGNTAGDKLVSTNWFTLNTVSDLSPVTSGKQVRMTVTLSRTDGGTGSYQNGQIRLAKKVGTQEWRYDCNLSEYDWKTGDNDLVVCLTDFVPNGISGETAEEGWKAINSVNVFTYADDNSGTYTITVSNLRIVDTDEQSEIDNNTIYMVPSAEAKAENIYNEFMYINGGWEQIGSTALNMSGYYTKPETDAAIRDAMYRVVDATSDSSGNYYANGIALNIVDGQAHVGSVSGGTASAGWASDNLVIPAYIRIPDGTVYKVTAIDDSALTNNYFTGALEYRTARVYIPNTITTFGINCFEQYYGDQGGHLYIVADGVTPSGYDADTTTVYDLRNPFLVVDYYTKEEVDAKLAAMQAQLTTLGGA